MKTFRMIAFVVMGSATWLSGSSVVGQVSINEYVDDERSGGASQIADTREFVELYNADLINAVDISGWTLVTKQLGGNFNLPAGLKTYTIPASQSIPAGGYYVVGAASVSPNFALTSGGFGTSGTNFFPDGADSTNGQHVLELRNSSNALVDALGNDIFRGSERTNLTAEHLAQVGGVRGGWWGQDPSFSVSSPNLRFSLARFQNGVDTNFNGRDFGMLPLTPGASNNLPLNTTHTIPNVDSHGLEADVTEYYASFVMPRAIDPTGADSNAINPTNITASPQGGKAIIAYDESGGGNSIYSKELVHKYDLYAYVQTGLLGTTTAGDLQDSEATIYGIGTTDGLFGTPDPLNSLNTGTVLVASSQNGSTGVGWMIERVETYNAGTPTATTSLLLIDFGDGGDGVPEDREWEVMKSYTITTSGWVRLSIEHNSATGVITAKKDADTFVYSVPNDFNNNGVVDTADYVLWRDNAALQNEAETVGTATADDYTSWRAHFGETTKTGELGTFYVGYRENLLDLSGNFSGSRPPTFDMIGGGGAFANVPEPSALALMAIACVAMAARRGQRGR